jgi:hypothetical protein
MKRAIKALTRSVTFDEMATAIHSNLRQLVFI